MNEKSAVVLEFEPQLNKVGKRKKLSDGLSAIVSIEDTLWLANDETASLERLVQRAGSTNEICTYGKHQQFLLNDYLQLPAPPSLESSNAEVDVEGLSYDHTTGYLWLVGSHSLKRGKPEAKKTVEKNFKRLAKVSTDSNRFILARIPMVKEDEVWTLKKKVELGGKHRTAAQLHADKSVFGQGNDLTEALRSDEHLQHFLTIPGKDNGFDIEGLAVAGKRVFVGLRGPVLRGWAVVLELEPQEDEASFLTLKRIGPNRRPYRKHFLRLDGLGIRDLCVYKSDLLILAGPTMDLDGPLTIFCWPGGAQPREESLVDEQQIVRLLELPVNQSENKGEDRAEGMTLFVPDASEVRNMLVVYDASSQKRRPSENAVMADLFPF